MCSSSFLQWNETLAKALPRALLYSHTHNTTVPQTSKYQDNYEFYVVRQKSPLFLGPCCGQTKGPFLAFKGSN